MRPGADRFAEALLVSACLHAALLILVPGWHATMPQVLPQPPLAVTLFVSRPQPSAPAVRPEPPPPPPAPVVRERPRPRAAPAPKPRRQVEAVRKPRTPQVVEPTVPAPEPAPAAMPPVEIASVPEPSVYEGTAATKAHSATLAARTPDTAVAQRQDIDARLLIGRFNEDLSRSVNARKRYPTIAQIRGWQGAVVLEVQVLPGGEFGAVTIARSSGHAVLDETAREMLLGADKPPLPAPLREKEFHVRLPVEFRLQ